MKEEFTEQEQTQDLTQSIILSGEDKPTTTGSIYAALEGKFNKGVTREAVAKFITRVIERSDFYEEELGRIYDVGRSSIANWRHLSRSETGFPQMDNLNRIAAAHDLPVWAILRCIELGEEPPPIKNFSRVYAKTLELAREPGDMSPKSLMDIAKSLEAIAKKMLSAQCLDQEQNTADKSAA